MAEQDEATTEIQLTQREGETTKEFEQRAWALVQSSPKGTVVTSTYEFGDLTAILRNKAREVKP